MSLVLRVLLAVQLANFFWLAPRSGWEFYFSALGLAGVAFANGHAFATDQNVKTIRRHFSKGASHV